MTDPSTDYCVDYTDAVMLNKIRKDPDRCLTNMQWDLWQLTAVLVAQARLAQEVGDTPAAYFDYLVGRLAKSPAYEDMRRGPAARAGSTWLPRLALTGWPLFDLEVEEARHARSLVSFPCWARRRDYTWTMLCWIRDNCFPLAEGARFDERFTGLEPGDLCGFCAAFWGGLGASFGLAARLEQGDAVCRVELRSRRSEPVAEDDPTRPRPSVAGDGWPKDRPPTFSEWARMVRATDHPAILNDRTCAAQANLARLLAIGLLYAEGHGIDAGDYIRRLFRLSPGLSRQWNYVRRILWEEEGTAIMMFATVEAWRLWDFKVLQATHRRSEAVFRCWARARDVYHLGEKYMMRPNPYRSFREFPEITDEKTCDFCRAFFGCMSEGLGVNCSLERGSEFCRVTFTG